MLKSVKLMPIANLTTEGVKDFVDAEKALISSIRKGEKPKAKRRPKSMAARRKAAAAGPVAHVGA
jgi:hypothetical protein